MFSFFYTAWFFKPAIVTTTSHIKPRHIFLAFGSENVPWFEMPVGLKILSNIYRLTKLKFGAGR